MKKHHVYIISGILLTSLGSYIAYLFPHLAGLHNAGMGLAVQGIFDWIYTTHSQKSKSP